MKELFDGRMAPATDTIGFLRSEVNVAADAFRDWQGAIQRPRGVTLSRSDLDGSFAKSILRLQPLTSVEQRRYLFIPTRSDWTAVLDNGHQGTDAFSITSFLAEKIGCDGLRVTAIPERPSMTYPATILEMYAPTRTDFLNITRSISATFDGKRWEFSASGQMQPFENPERYEATNIKHRFDGEMMNAYLTELGVSAFDEDFYQPIGEAAILVEKSGPIAPSSREFMLTGEQTSKV